MLHTYWQLNSPYKIRRCLEDIAEDVKTRFDTSNYKFKRRLLKRVIRRMKNRLSWNIMKKIVSLRLKLYSYLSNDEYVGVKAKGIKKCVIKRQKKCQDLKEFLKKNKILKLQQRFMSEAHNIFTEKFKKIVLSVNDDKRIQTPGGVISYPLWHRRRKSVQGRIGIILKNEKSSIVIKWVMEGNTLFLCHLNNGENKIARIILARSTKLYETFDIETEKDPHYLKRDVFFFLWSNEYLIIDAPVHR